jgi:hypothetical protein
MPLRRTAVAVAAGALLLTGCEKPTPAVGVFSGTTYEHVDAVCWNRDDAPVDEQECDPAGADVGEIPVRANETVGISVDPEVAEGGWFPTINDQQLVEEPITETYYRFALGLGDVRGEELLLRVQAVTGEGEELGVRGTWLFRLQPS